MNVIFHAADLNGMESVFFGNAANISPDPVLDFRDDPSLTVLGAEDEMVMKGGVGIGHGSSGLGVVRHG